MKFQTNTRNRFQRPGAVLVIVLLMVVAMLTLSGFCIGVSQIQLASTEAQIVADVGSLSASTMFGEEQNHRGSYNTPLEVAKFVPLQNTVMGSRATIADQNVTLGNARMGLNGKMRFTPNATPLNAVKVVVELGDNASMSAQNLLFPFRMSATSFGLKRESISAKLEHDICVVLDRSGSMRSSSTPGGRYPYHPNRRRVVPPMPWPWSFYRSVYWQYFAHPTDSRWGAVVAAMDPLVASLRETPMSEQCSIVTFGTRMNNRWGINYNASDTNVAPTQDYSSFRSTLEALGESRPMEGGTHISAGMDRARDILTGPNSRGHAYKTMVVLTDGNENSGSNAVRSARFAAQQGITVHTVTFASSSGFRTMQRTADAGGGTAYWAPDEKRLREIFAEIGSAPPVSLIE